MCRVSRRAGALTGAPLLVPVLLWMSACGGATPEADGDPEISAHLRISPTPPMAGAALVAVEVLDAGEPAPADASVTVIVQGADGARTSARALGAGSEGRWEGEVAFPAPGQVTVEVRATLPSGRTARFRFPVTVTRRPGG